MYQIQQTGVFSKWLAGLREARARPESRHDSIHGSGIRAAAEASVAGFMRCEYLPALVIVSNSRYAGR